MTRPESDAALRSVVATSFAALLAVLGGCITHTVQTAPIEIKPIHVTVDVNVKVQRELDKFFDFETKGASSRPTSSDSKE